MFALLGPGSLYPLSLCYFRGNHGQAYGKGDLSSIDVLIAQWATLCTAKERFTFPSSHDDDYTKSSLFLLISYVEMQKNLLDIKNLRSPFEHSPKSRYFTCSQDGWIII